MIKRFLASTALVLGLATAAQADITTGKFGTAQIFDVQWNVSGGNLNTFSYSYLYRSVPSSSRMNASDYSAIASAGQYFAFFDSTTNPGTYGMALYNSDGSVAEVIHNTGTFRVLADGAIFYLGNGFWGTLITTAEGFDIGDSSSFTVEEDRPSNSTMSVWVPDTTEVLAAGETAGSGGGAPTITGTSTATVQTSSTTTTGTASATTTVARGDTTRITTVAHDVGETTTTQTVEQTTTHTDTTPVTTTIVTTTPVTTRTCSIVRTTTTYSDSTTTTSDSSETCTDTTTNNVVTSANTVDDVVATPIVETFSGRVDQLATAQDITNSVVRGLEFNGLNGLTANHNYDNGMDGTTRGFTLGGKTTNDNGVILGGGLARFSTDVDDADNNTAGASTTVLDANIGRRVENGTVTFGLRHAMTDYSISRTIGDWANTGSTSGTDSSARLMFEGNGEKLKPVVGYTRGKRTTDAYTEGGDALTARSVAESNEWYGYATIGGTVDFGLLDVTALRHTDGVNQLSVGLEKESETVNWELRLNRTMTNQGDTNSISAGLVWKF
jgi:hypothetical protein